MNKQTSVDHLLLDLERDSISDSEKADILFRIIEIESAKSEEDADMELIQECVEFLNILTNSETEIKMQESQVADRLQQIYQKAAEDTTSENTDLTQHQPVIRKRRLRSFGIIAASFAFVILIAATSLTVIARVNGYGNMWEWLSDHMNEIFHLNSGEEHSIDGITVVVDNDATTYPDIETWLQKTSMDILYPTVLPDDVKLERILQSSQSENEISMIWVFNISNVRFSVQNYDLSYFELSNDAEIIDASGYRFNILYRPETGYQAFCIAGDYAYSIECADRESLLTIINHLKGIEK